MDGIQALALLFGLFLLHGYPSRPFLGEDRPEGDLVLGSFGRASLARKIERASSY